MNPIGWRGLFQWLTGRPAKDQRPPKARAKKPAAAVAFKSKLDDADDDDDERTVMDNSEELTIRDPRSEVDKERVPGGFRYNPNLMAAIPVGPTPEQVAALAEEIARKARDAKAEYQSQVLPWLSVQLSRADGKTTVAFQTANPKALEVLKPHAAALQSALVKRGLKAVALAL